MYLPSSLIASRLVHWLVGSAAGLFLLAPLGHAQVNSGTILDRVVAVVEGEPVLLSEVDALAASTGTAVNDSIWSRALDEVIAQKVLIARAEADTTLNVSEDMVTQQVETRVAELTRRAGGETELTTYYGKPIDEIKTFLRDDVRRQILAQQYQGRKLREVTIAPSEVRAWFASIPSDEIPEVPELVRVAHIVKRPLPDPAAQQAARAFADALRDSILADDLTIEEAARRHSADPGSAARGGAYASVNTRDLVPEFGIVAASLEAGALSQVFETPFGYHVMRLNERKGDVVSFNHVLIQADETNVDTTAAIAALEAIRDSVVTLNMPFELAAKRNSDDPLTAAQGGYLSDTRTGERNLQLALLGPLWQATIDTLDVDQVSEPTEVELADGSRAWHLVLVQRRTPAHVLSIETDYAILSEYALRDKHLRVMEDWLDDLRRTAYVEVKTNRYVRAPASG